MATPRRSSRIRSGGTPAQTLSRKPGPALDSLAEHEASPVRITSRRDGAGVESPGKIPGASAEVKTPESSKQPKPSHYEMHPQHAHQSTVKMSNAGLQLGFADVNPYQSSPLRPSHRITERSPIVSNNAMSSPAYQFSFNRDEKELGEEAQRIMASVRDEAARIKEKMRAEREEQRRRDLEAEGEAGVGGRRFAKPKSRYSDVHKAEFSKMQSIADHVSVWKNKMQGSKQPRQIEQRPVPTPNLKRTHSKVDLQAPKAAIGTPALKRQRSRANLQDPASEKKKAVTAKEVPQNEGLSTVKRRKIVVTQDVSALRPGSSGTIGSKIPTASKGGLPAAAATPTKSSLARSHSVKNISPTKLPTSSLARTKSLRTLSKPGGLRTASGRIVSAVANKVNSMKSILHKPQPKYSDDPVKIAAGTHVPMPRATPSHHEGTPSLPATPRPHHTLPRPSPKKVEFAPDTKGSTETEGSPSPTKSVPIQYPVLPLSLERAASMSPPKSIGTEDDVPTPKAAYPTPSKATPASCQRSRSLANPLFSHPPTAGDFTFTHDKRIKFGSDGGVESRSATSVSSRPSIRALGTSIRHIGPSDSQPAVHYSVSRLKPGTESQHLIFGVPHGIGNKKRARENEVDSSDIENMDPKLQDEDEAMGQGSPRKRVKKSSPPSTKTAQKKPERTRRQTGFGTSAQKRAGLSLARLNFLATPKERR